MKVRVSLKDPDTMQDSVDDAFKREQRPDGISDREWASIRDDRASEVKDIIADKWMQYGEYLVVDFDTDAGTATVVPTSELKR